MVNFTTQLQNSIQKCLNPLRVDPTITQVSDEDYPLGITIQINPRVHYLWINSFPDPNRPELGEITLTLYIFDNVGSFNQSKSYLVGAVLPWVDYPESYPVNPIKGLVYQKTITVRFPPKDFIPDTSINSPNYIWSYDTDPEGLLSRILTEFHVADFNLNESLKSQFQ